ncbi:MAG: hypothetical protein KDJ29_02400 [Hyphomicrobiales bacterium]|nr:hypothetical protein [Hyphomicrobiales bacterium]
MAQNETGIPRYSNPQQVGRREASISIAPGKGIEAFFGSFIVRIAPRGPLTWIGLFALAAILVLTFRSHWPIGSYYWDIVLYPDAAWRIANGQIPFVDFFAPAGAYGYYAYAVLERLFPNGHMTLLANWSILIVALPLLVHVVREIDRHSRPMAWAFAAPFLILAALPFNAEDISPGFGLDGYGIYNRHAILLLYILTGEILLSTKRQLNAVFLAAVMLALFHVKITGFAIATVLVAQAAMAGRINRGALLLAALIFLDFNLVIEWRYGMVSAYIASIMELIAMNGSSMFAQLRDAIVLYIMTILPLLGLAALLAFSGLMGLEINTRIAEALQRKGSQVWLAAVKTLTGSLPIWIASTTCGAVIFESQNTGSLQFAFVWPALIAAAATVRTAPAFVRHATFLLIAAAVIPQASGTLHRMLRVGPALMTYKPLGVETLGPLGDVSSKLPEINQARRLNAHFAEAHAHYARLAAHHIFPAPNIYATNEFQLSWMLAADEAVKSIRQLETDKAIRFERIIALDFVNPFSFVLGREPVRHISIGMSEGRTVPPLTPARSTAAANADLFLEPKCPVTPTQTVIKKVFEPVLSNRVRLPLSRCWDMYVKPDMAARISGK